MNARFARRLLDALGGDSPANVVYRRAVPTAGRAGLAPPPLPVAGLTLAPEGVATLDPTGFPGGRLTAESVDAALHAARVAGAEWAAARVRNAEDAAVLRSLAFVPLGV